MAYENNNNNQQQPKNQFLSAIYKLKQGEAHLTGDYLVHRVPGGWNFIYKDSNGSPSSAVFVTKPEKPM